MNYDVLSMLLTLALLNPPTNIPNAVDTNADIKAEIKKLKAEYMEKFRELTEIGKMIKRLEALIENEKKN